METRNEWERRDWKTRAYLKEEDRNGVSSWGSYSSTETQRERKQDTCIENANWIRETIARIRRVKDRRLWT
jgi:hypothetical protein